MLALVISRGLLFFSRLFLRSCQLYFLLVSFVHVLRLRSSSCLALCFAQTNTTTILKEYYPGMNRLMYGVVGGNYEADKHSSALQVCGSDLCL